MKRSPKEREETSANEDQQGINLQSIQTIHAALCKKKKKK